MEHHPTHDNADGRPRHGGSAAADLSQHFPGTLHAEVERLLAVIDNAAAGLLITDPDLNIVHVNDHADALLRPLGADLEPLLGVAVDDLTDTTALALVRPLPEATRAEAAQRLAAGVEPLTATLAVGTAAVHLSFTPAVADHSGEFFGQIVTVRVRDAAEWPTRLSTIAERLTASRISRAERLKLSEELSRIADAA